MCYSIRILDWLIDANHHLSADLVPVFSFGENDVRYFPVILPLAYLTDAFQIYQQMPSESGTTIYAFQKRFQRMFGFTLPLFHGRGLLNCKSFWKSIALKIVNDYCRQSWVTSIPPQDRIRQWVQGLTPRALLYSRNSVGCPIHIEKCEKPTLDDVTRVQTKYIEELTRSVPFNACEVWFSVTNDCCA